MDSYQSENGPSSASEGDSDVERLSAESSGSRTMLDVLLLEFERGKEGDWEKRDGHWVWVRGWPRLLSGAKMDVCAAPG